MSPGGLVHRLGVILEPFLDAVLRRLRGPTPHVTIVTYLGHGSARVATVGGRVLAGPPVGPATGPERLSRRVRRMLARFATRELSGIDLEIEMDGSIARAVTDEEGYWDVRIAADPPPPQGGHGAGRHPVAVRVGGGLDPAAVVHRMDDDAAVLVPAPTARHLVVSDVDDTVLATGVGRTARVVARTLTSSAWSRRPVPGVPALLRSLRDGPDGCADNPCFYVSSSPWNLYGFLRAFLDRHECPLGPIVLSDYGISNEFVVRRSHQLHKLDAIDTILDIHPSTPAVLVGDTTEADPAIYLRIATERPDRVLAVLLHDDGSDASRARRADELFADVDVPVAIGDASTLTTAVARHIGSATRTR